MHKLRKLEEASHELSYLLDNALLSNSREEKERALRTLHDSELMNNATRLRVYIDPEHPIVSLITLATFTLPEQIKGLQKKANLVQIQLAAEQNALDTENQDTPADELVSVEKTLAQTCLLQ